MSFFKKKSDSVQHIELSEKHKKVRLVLICVLIVIAAAAFTTALMSYLNGDPGWRTIEVSTSEVNCADDFIFNYYFPDTGRAAAAATKQITSLYTEAAEKAYWLFSADETKDDLVNVCYINRHPNEVLTVDPVLYDAFALLEGSGSRHLYLAGIYTEYDNLFFSESDAQAAYRDPVLDEETEDYVNQILAFVNDPAQVSLELLGDDQLRLNVSAEYLAFAEEYEIDGFIDFHWMSNAFITDYFADVMTEAGYTDGYFASFDGFTRNLHNAEESYSLNIFDLVDNGIYLAGRMEYTRPMSIVYLRGYPISQSDSWHYYAYADGRIVTSYIDPTDGLSRTAADTLVSYSGTDSCARILVRLLPVYIAGELDTAPLQTMAEDEIYSIWCRDQVIYYNDASLQLYDLLDDDGLRYTKELVK